MKKALQDQLGITSQITFSIRVISSASELACVNSPLGLHFWCVNPKKFRHNRPSVKSKSLQTIENFGMTIPYQNQIWNKHDLLKTHLSSSPSNVWNKFKRYKFLYRTNINTIYK